MNVMPFHEFPPEIIQRVFRLCVVVFIIPPRKEIRKGTEHVNQHPWRMRILTPRNETRPGTTQVTLSLVCSRWREIALNTRTLWGDVKVYYDTAKDPGQDSDLTASFQFLHNWLNRAGRTPISLSISVFESWESNLAAISQTLVYSFHVTNLCLESVECDYPLLPPNKSYHLERLDLYVDEMALPIDAFPCLPGMPSLKELRLGLELDFFRDLTNFYLIPWHQLRALAILDCLWTSQTLLNILQRCKSLVEFALSVSLYEEYVHDIVLPHLESLVLKMDSGGSVDSLIRSLTVPNLRSLHIRSKPWNSHTKLPFSTEAIVLMAQRSGFKCLTDFELCRTKKPVDVMSLLESMPALERVRFHGQLVLQQGIFDDLSSGMIGPQLEEMCFGIMSDKEIGLLLEAVGRRYEKAKTVSDIRPFASVTCGTRGSRFESHSQQAKQCGEAFNTHIEIHQADQADFDMETGSDEESYVDEESSFDVFFPDEEPVEELNAGEESHSFGKSESDEENYGLEYSRPPELDQYVGLDSQSGEESDA